MYKYIVIFLYMEKHHRTRKYSRKNRPNKHSGQRLNHRYHGCSTNTVKTARRKKSTHTRRVLKDELSKVYLKHPDLFYGKEEGYVDVGCECRGWDEDGNLICDENLMELQDIPNSRPASCSYKTTDKHYDHWGFFKTNPIRQRSKPKPHQYKKNKWKDSLGTKLEKSPLCKHYGVYYRCERNKKPLRAGLRQDVSLVPYGEHPLDEPRWWEILPNNCKIKKMSFDYIDHEDYLLALGNYRVELKDPWNLKKPIMSDRSLRQLEKNWAYDKGYMYDWMEDINFDWVGTDVDKNKLNVLWMLRRYKMDHLEYYDRRRFKEYKPTKPNWKIHRFGTPMCPLLIALQPKRIPLIAPITNMFGGTIDVL